MRATELKMSTQKRLAVTRLIYRTFTPEEFGGLPGWAKQRVTKAALRDLRRIEKSPTPKASSRRRAAQPVRRRKTKAQLTRWAKKVATEVEARKRTEAEQRSFERTPHAYFGSRW